MTNSGMSILFFIGAYRFLSNFYPCNIYMGGLVYPSVEHAYNALKTYWDHERHAVLQAPTPGIAKQVGRRVTIRENWDAYKVDLMELLVFQKFSLYVNLRSWLVATGEAHLEEGNNWNDTFWGVCKGVGENHLGKILMRVRSCLKQ